MVFTTAKNVTKHLGYFCNKNYCKLIPKIAQSGHTMQDELSSVVEGVYGLYFPKW